MQIFHFLATVKPVKRPLSKRPQIGFQLNAGQKYCKMFQGEHSAILSTFIKLPFAIKIFVLSIFEWPFYTEFTVVSIVEQASLSLALSETLKIGFVVLRPISELNTGQEKPEDRNKQKLNRISKSFFFL